MTNAELEEAAEKWVFENCFDCDIVGEHRANDAFKAGSKWQKEQIMKEAMEGEVIVPIYEGKDVWSAEIKIPGRYEPGDKVRITIVKE